MSTLSANIYCVLNGATHHVGSHDMEFDGPASELLQRIEANDQHIINNLSKLAFNSIKDNSKLTIEEMTKSFTSFKVGNIVVNFFWLGKESPSCDILKWERVLSQQYMVRLYTLSLGCILCLDTPTIFIIILKQYIHSYNAVEEADLFDKKKIFRCLFHQDKKDSLPYCYVFSSDKSQMPHMYNEVISKCPKGYICCEYRAIFMKQIFYVAEDKLVKGEVVLLTP